MIRPLGYALCAFIAMYVYSDGDELASFVCFLLAFAFTYDDAGGLK